MLTKPEKLQALTRNKQTLYDEFLRRVFPVERATQLWRSMRKTRSCRKTSELPGCSSSLIGQKIFFSGQSEAGNSNASGTGSVRVSAQGLVSIFHHGHFIELTNCPWVSEDDRRRREWSCDSWDTEVDRWRIWWTEVAQVCSLVVPRLWLVSKTRHSFRLRWPVHDQRHRIWTTAMNCYLDLYNVVSLAKSDCRRCQTLY